jgi:hypothetical protein
MHFAQGGQVGAGAAGGMSIDYGRLAAALSAQRPLANHVTIQPHDYNDFQRQEQRIRVAGAGNGWGT